MRTIHNARVDTVGLAAHSMTADALTRRTPQKANPSSLALLVFLGLSLAAVDAIRVNCQTRTDTRRTIWALSSRMILGDPSASSRDASVNAR